DTARERIFNLIEAVQKDKTKRLDVFAYDLNEPDFVRALLDLAKDGRVRIILDNAALHHNGEKPKHEDQVQALFEKAAKTGATLIRGKFGRYSHDKVLIVYDGDAPKTVLTGSTNFSVTGLYVNSNHVLVFDDAKAAGTYADLFEACWKAGAKRAAFL